MIADLVIRISKINEAYEMVLIILQAPLHTVEGPRNVISY